MVMMIETAKPNGQCGFFCYRLKFCTQLPMYSTIKPMHKVEEEDEKRCYGMN